MPKRPQLIPPPAGIDHLTGIDPAEADRICRELEKRYGRIRPPPKRS